MTEQLKKLTVIDADSILWILAYKFKSKSSLTKLNLSEVNLFVKSILSNTKADFYVGFVGGEGKNFRKYLDPLYKGNRPPTPDWFKLHSPVIKQHLMNFWKFIPADNIEADDACSILANHHKGEYDITVAAVDKDLRQIPNIVYYNYKLHTAEAIDDLTAAKAKATLILAGDSGDNIKGLPKVGPVKAAELLANSTTVAQVNLAVVRAYCKSLNTSDVVSRAEKAAIRDAIDTEGSIKSWSKKQKERKIRIALIALTTERKKASPWRRYFKLQNLLVSTLITPRFNFVIPEVTAVEKVKEATEAEFNTILDGI